MNKAAMMQKMAAAEAARQRQEQQAPQSSSNKPVKRKEPPETDAAGEGKGAAAATAAGEPAHKKQKTTEQPKAAAAAPAAPAPKPRQQQQQQPKAAGNKGKPPSREEEDERALYTGLFADITDWEIEVDPPTFLAFDLTFMMYILWEFNGGAGASDAKQKQRAAARITEMRRALGAWFEIAFEHLVDNGKIQNMTKPIPKSVRIKMLKLFVKAFITEDSAKDIEGFLGGPLTAFYASLTKRTSRNVHNLFEDLRQRGLRSGNAAVVCLDLRPLDRSIKSRAVSFSEQQILSHAFYLGFLYHRHTQVFNSKHALSLAALARYSTCAGLPLLVSIDALMRNTDATKVLLPLPNSGQRGVLDFLWKGGKGTIVSLPDVNKDKDVAADFACSFLPWYIRKICLEIQERSSKGKTPDLNSKDIVLQAARPLAIFSGGVVKRIIRPRPGAVGDKIKMAITRLVAAFYNVQMYRLIEAQTQYHMSPLHAVDPNFVYSDLVTASRWNDWCECVRLLQEREDPKGKESKVVKMVTTTEEKKAEITRARILRIHVNNREFFRVAGSNSEPLSAPEAMELGGDDDKKETKKKKEPDLVAAIDQDILVESLLASSRDETDASPITWWTDRPNKEDARVLYGLPTFCCQYTHAGQWIHLTPTSIGVLLLIQAWEFNMLLDLSIAHGTSRAEGLIRVVTAPPFLWRMIKTIDRYTQRVLDGQFTDERSELVIDYRVRDYLSSMRSILEESERKAAKFSPPTIVLDPTVWKEATARPYFNKDAVPYCIDLLNALQSNGQVDIPLPTSANPHGQIVASGLWTLLSVSVSDAKAKTAIDNLFGAASVAESKRRAAASSSSSSSSNSMVDEGEGEEDLYSDVDDADDIGRGDDLLPENLLNFVRSRAGALASSAALAAKTPSRTAVDTADVIGKEAKRRAARSTKVQAVLEQFTRMAQDRKSELDKVIWKANADRLAAEGDELKKLSAKLEAESREIMSSLEKESDPENVEAIFAMLDAAGTAEKKRRDELARRYKEIQARPGGAQTPEDKRLVTEYMRSLASIHVEHSAAETDAKDEETVMKDEAVLMEVAEGKGDKKEEKKKTAKDEAALKEIAKERKKPLSDSGNAMEESDGDDDEDEKEDKTRSLLELSDDDVDREEVDREEADQKIVQALRDRSVKAAKEGKQEGGGDGPTPTIRTVTDYVDFLGLPLRPLGQLATGDEDGSDGFEMYFEIIQQFYGDILTRPGYVGGLIKVPESRKILDSGLLFANSQFSGFETRNRLICAMLISRKRFARTVLFETAPVSDNDDINKQLDLVREFSYGQLPALPCRTAAHLKDADDLLFEATRARHDAANVIDGVLLHLKPSLRQTRQKKNKNKNKKKKKDEEEEDGGDDMVDDSKLTKQPPLNLTDAYKLIRDNQSIFQNAAMSGLAHNVWASMLRTADSNPDHPETIAQSLTEALTILESGANSGLYTIEDAPTSADAHDHKLLEIDKKLGAEGGAVAAIKYGMTHALRIRDADEVSESGISIETAEVISLMQNEVSNWIEGPAKRVLEYEVGSLHKAIGRQGGGGDSKATGDTKSQAVVQEVVVLLKSRLNVRSSAWLDSATKLLKAIDDNKKALHEKMPQRKKKEDNDDEEEFGGVGSSEAWSILFGPDSTLTDAILQMDIGYFRDVLHKDIADSGVAEFSVTVARFIRDRHRWYSFVEAAFRYVSNVTSALLFASHAMYLRNWRFGDTAERKSTAKKAVYDGWRITNKDIATLDHVFSAISQNPPDHELVEAATNRIVEAYSVCKDECLAASYAINYYNSSSSQSSTGDAGGMLTLHLDLDIDVQNLVQYPAALLRTDMFSPEAHASVLGKLDPLVDLTITVCNSTATRNAIRSLLGSHNTENALELGVIEFMIEQARQQEAAVAEYKRDVSLSFATYRHELVPLEWEHLIPGLEIVDPKKGWWSDCVVTLRSLAQWIKTGVNFLIKQQEKNPQKLLRGHDVLWKQIFVTYKVFEACRKTEASQWTREFLTQQQEFLVSGFFVYSKSGAIQNSDDLAILEGAVIKAFREHIKVESTRLYPVTSSPLDPATIDLTQPLPPDETLDQSAVVRITGMLQENNLLSSSSSSASSSSLSSSSGTDLSASLYNLYVAGKKNLDDPLSTYLSQVRIAHGIIIETKEEGVVAKKRRLIKNSLLMDTSGRPTLSHVDFVRSFARDRQGNSSVDELSYSMQSLQVTDGDDYAEEEEKARGDGSSDGMRLRDYAYE